VPRLPTFYHRSFESTYGRSITTVDIVPVLVAERETLLLPEAIGGLLGALAGNRAPPVSERRLIFGLNTVLRSVSPRTEQAYETLTYYSVTTCVCYHAITVTSYAILLAEKSRPAANCLFFPLDFIIKHATQKLCRP